MKLKPSAEVENPVEPDEQIDVQQIKTRSISGVTALISRTFAVQVISFLSTLGLTIFLDPSVYGVFYLVSAVVNFLAYFSDVGLAAALIQKKEKIKTEDLATTFTIQQLLVISLLVILFSASSFIRNSYHLNSAGIFLLWSLAISLFLSSLKTIPSILLERELQFNKLVIPQIAETIVFNLVAVFFAWRGFGITAFTFAVLARGITGLVLMYMIAPWRPRIGISRSSLSHLLKFGLPFQANTFLAVAKDDGMTIVLGKLVGADGLGYLGWASRWAGLPLRIFMDNITKVTFPAFSRLQHDKDRLIRAIETSLKYLCLATFPALVAMGLLARPMIFIIPRYVKWLPALIPLYIYLYNSAWASVSTTLTNTLNALGKIKTTFKLMIMWTSLTWALMPALAFYKGYLGVSYAVALIATSSIFTIIAVRKHLAFSFTKAFRTPIIASIGLAAYFYAASRFATNTLHLAIVGVIGVIIYGLIVVLLEGKAFVIETVKYFKPHHA